MRHGDEEHPGSGLALIISNDEEGEKYMELGELRAGETWIDMTGNRPEELTLDERGGATFPVSPRNLAVWIRKPIA